MRIKGFLFIIIIISITTIVESQESFISPLKIPLSLSANFGELRPDHYHSGIDIKTQGVTGKEVVASADGYVYLILISPVGFGKAIYIRHPFGLSTVYAHLDNFSPEIEEYVKYQQYRNKTFAITITPPQDRLPIKKGQVIAYSGNTGGSTGPHLHFEIRKSDSEKPVDPLKYDFGLSDNIKPVIERLVVYPVSKNATINGSHSRSVFDVSGYNGNYTLAEGQEMRIYGVAGFGISAFDNMNDMPNRFGISLIELMIDSLPWFTYEIKEFSFAESRYINAHVDYAARVRFNSEIERTFVLPNDKLSLYRNFMNNGLFDFSDNKSHTIRITVRDSFGNKTALSFNVVPGIQPVLVTDKAVTDSNIVVMPYGKENIFQSSGVRIVIPNGSLYDTLNFKYSKVKLNGSLLSEVHEMHNRYTPLHKPAKLSIKPDTIPSGKSSKLIIVQLDEKGTRSSVGGTFSGGVITTDIRSFGSYAVSMDTIAPVISANGYLDGADLSEKSSIRIRITDNLSGIKSYSGLIDGNWALFEYDAKNDLIFYKFDPKRLTKGATHQLEITVTDNCNNSSNLKRSFTW
jgi:hypothetical protein